MKRVIFSLIFIIVIGSFAFFNKAQAGTSGFFGNPVYEATMTMVSGSGYFQTVDNISLTMMQQSSSASPTGFVLDLTKTSRSTRGSIRESFQLAIVDQIDIGCGSRQYVAETIFNARHHILPYPRTGQSLTSLIQNTVILILTDHSQRTCQDLQPHTWVATIRKGLGSSRPATGMMLIQGNAQRFSQSR